MDICFRSIYVSMYIDMLVWVLYRYCPVVCPWVCPKISKLISLQVPSALESKNIDPKHTYIYDRLFTLI